MVSAARVGGAGLGDAGERSIRDDTVDPATDALALTDRLRVEKL